MKMVRVLSLLPVGKKKEQYYSAVLPVGKKKEPLTPDFFRPRGLFPENLLSDEQISPKRSFQMCRTTANEQISLFCSFEPWL